MTRVRNLVALFLMTAALLPREARAGEKIAINLQSKSPGVKYGIGERPHANTYERFMRRVVSRDALPAFLRAQGAASASLEIHERDSFAKRWVQGVASDSFEIYERDAFTIRTARPKGDQGVSFRVGLVATPDGPRWVVFASGASPFMTTGPVGLAHVKGDLSEAGLIKALDEALDNQFERSMR